ncbi:host-nuclease inhibitor Gam family protein [Staphylococcus rostri]
MLQEQELENIEQRDEGFKVRDLSSANWVFKKLDAIYSKEKEIQGLAHQEVERIKEWESRELEKLEDNKGYLEHLVIEYFKEEREKDAKFKLSTPFGKVSSRIGAKVLQMSNEQLIIDQLEERGLTDFVKTTKKLNQADIKKHFNVTDSGDLIDENGEPLDGVKLVRKPTSYTVKVGS